MKLIDKDKVVKAIKEYYFKDDLLRTLNTLEVKDVDLEKYYHDFLQKEWFDKNCTRTISEMMFFTAKHFFELGLKANQEYNVIGTIEREVKIDAGGYPYIDCYIEFYDYDKDIPLAKEGDKVKVIVMKGE